MANEPPPSTAPPSQSGVARITLKLGKAGPTLGSSPGPSPTIPQKASFAPVERDLMDWQPAAPSFDKTTATIPPPKGETSQAAAIPPAHSAPPPPAQSFAAKAEEKPKPPPRKRKKAGDSPGPGKAWRKGLKGYGDGTAAPPEVKAAPIQDTVPVEKPQAKSAATAKGPFLNNQTFDPRTPKPRKWERAPLALKLLSGKTLSLPSWQGAEDSPYIASRQQAIKERQKAPLPARSAPSLPASLPLPPLGSAMPLPPTTLSNPYASTPSVLQSAPKIDFSAAYAVRPGPPQP